MSHWPGELYAFQLSGYGATEAFKINEGEQMPVMTGILFDFMPLDGFFFLFGLCFIFALG